ncbi:single-stranded DNA-specific DHH superfamily exonuclease [Bradyrhizobium sp. AZCC 2230]
MKPSSPTLTLTQLKAIREIEQRLVELERRRQKIEREMRDDAETEPTARRCRRQAGQFSLVKSQFQGRPNRLF